MSSEFDEKFEGVISGYEVKILLNLNRMKIEIQSQSKDVRYQVEIKYDKDDQILKNVKQVFPNLSLLFEYILDYSQDPQRIRIDLFNEQMKITKNEELRRSKKAPVLIIPLKKVYEEKRRIKTPLEINLQAALKHSQILQFKYKFAKNERQGLMKEYHQIREDLMKIFLENKIDYQDFFQNQDQETENMQKNFIIRENLYPNDQIYYGRDYQSFDEAKQSLFFESQSLQQTKNGHQDQEKIKQEHENEPYQQTELQNQTELYDPFSYL